MTNTVFWNFAFAAGNSLMLAMRLSVFDFWREREREVSAPRVSDPKPRGRWGLGGGWQTYQLGGREYCSFMRSSVHSFDILSLASSSVLRPSKAAMARVWVSSS